MTDAPDRPRRRGRARRRWFLVTLVVLAVGAALLLLGVGPHLVDDRASAAADVPADHRVADAAAT